jgi:DNA-directed RNA polymerase specialized sigma24 family protein
MHPITNPSERFSLLYQETFDRLSQYVLLKAGSLSDAEDVVSAVYAAYYERVILRGRRPPDHAYAYLKRMANHELGQIYRLRRNQQSLDADWPEAESGLPRRAGQP